MKKNIFIISILVLFVLSLTIFKNPGKLGVQDWDVKYAKAFCNIESIVKYHQFPIWNPYHCGGISQIGDGTNDYLSPLFIFNIILGPNIGYRIIFILYLIIGLFSFYKLGKFLKLSNLASIFCSVVYVFSGLFFQRLAGGHPEFFPLTLLPLLLFYYLNALKTHSIKMILKSCIVLTLIFFGGFQYLPIIIIFLLVITIGFSIINKNLKPIIIMIYFLLIFSLISSIKLTSVIEQTLRYPRYVQEEYSGYSLKSLSSSLISKNQTNENFPFWGNNEKISLIDGLNYSIVENGAYIGLFPLILFIIGLFEKNKNKKIMLITMIIFLYISFGFNIAPSAYGFIQHFPIFNNLRVAQRYNHFFIIPLLFISGLGLDFLLQKIKSKVKGYFLQNLIIHTLLMLTVLDLIFINTKTLKQTFLLPIITIKKTNTFAQSRGNLYYDESGFLKEKSINSSFSSEYPYLTAGYGVAGYCYEARTIMPNNNYIESPTYEGEYHLKNRMNSIKNTYWSPNKLIFKLDIKADDRLFVNQMFDNGWKVISNNKKIKPTIINNNNLIEINVKPGKYQVVLYYQPLSFIIGATLTSLSIIIIIIFLYINKDNEPRLFNSTFNTKSRPKRF